jgi:hypothetical protein
MMMHVTEVHLKQGAELEWNSVMRERLTAARKQPGGSAVSSSSRRSLPRMRHRRHLVHPFRLGEITRGSEFARLAKPWIA